eukprot:4871521-Amphidinium_carterae.1
MRELARSTAQYSERVANEIDFGETVDRSLQWLHQARAGANAQGAPTLVGGGGIYWDPTSTVRRTVIKKPCGELSRRLLNIETEVKEWTLCIVLP